MSVELSYPEQKTIEYYDLTAKEWAANHDSQNFWDEELGTFHNLLPSGEIIEIGVGAGRDAEKLIRMGYHYTGIEPSRSLYEIASRRNPSGLFSIQTVYDLAFPVDKFDGFWACAVLLHIPKEKIALALNTIHRIVKNRGVGFIAVKKGDGVQIETERVGKKMVKRQFVYYQDEEFQNILQDNGFKVTQAETKPVSERTTWLDYFVEVNK